MPNLVEGLLEQMNRCRELAIQYDALPDNVGAFGAAMIKQDIENAEKAMSSGDTVEMLRCYEALKGCE
jgi:hypothetical protein